MTETRRTRVAVVFGGRSAEHAISCVSAGSVMAALDPERYEVVPVGITREGGWVLHDGASTGHRRRPAARGHRRDGGHPGRRPGRPRTAPAGRTTRPLIEVDVVFPVLHGAYGEDGTVQGLLEMSGLPYVGSGVFASAASMDKEFTKKLLAAAGIAQGDHVVLRDAAGALTTDPSALSAAQRERLGLPVFVKPSRAGSSIGITKVTDWADLDAAVATAAAVDTKVVVEAAVPGREVECGVLAACRRRAARDQPARGDPAQGRRRLVRLRRQVPRRRRRLRRARRPHPRADRRGAGRLPPGLPRPGLPRAGPGRLLPRHRPGDRRGPAGGQRGQHDARLHADLDVPADVGRLRRATTRSWSTGSSPAPSPRGDARAAGCCWSGCC